MANFLLLADGNYVNAEMVKSIYAMGSGSSWYLDVDVAAGPVFAADTLEGTWSTKAEAQEAARRLVKGIDPSTY